MRSGVACAAGTPQGGAATWERTTTPRLVGLRALRLISGPQAVAQPFRLFATGKAGLRSERATTNEHATNISAERCRRSATQRGARAPRQPCRLGSAEGGLTSREHRPSSRSDGTDPRSMKHRAPCAAEVLWSSCHIVHTGRGTRGNQDIGLCEDG